MRGSWSRTHVPFWQQPRKQVRADRSGVARSCRSGAAAGVTEVPLEALPELAIPDDPPPMHAPRWHCPPAVVQSVHAAPRKPQAVLSVPGAQPSFDTATGASDVQLDASSLELPVSSPKRRPPRHSRRCRRSGRRYRSCRHHCRTWRARCLRPRVGQWSQDLRSRGRRRSNRRRGLDLRRTRRRQSGAGRRSRPRCLDACRGASLHGDETFPCSTGSPRPDDEAILVIRLGGEKSARQPRRNLQRCPPIVRLKTL